MSNHDIVLDPDTTNFRDIDSRFDRNHLIVVELHVRSRGTVAGG